MESELAFDGHDGEAPAGSPSHPAAAATRTEKPSMENDLVATEDVDGGTSPANATVDVVANGRTFPDASAIDAGTKGVTPQTTPSEKLLMLEYMSIIV